VNITVSGIEEVRAGQLVLYPVPAKDICYIDGLEPSDVIAAWLADAQGRTVRIEVVPHADRWVLSIAGMASGIYQLGLITEDGSRYTGKLTILQ
jgi:hypothetical protein